MPLLILDCRTTSSKGQTRIRPQQGEKEKWFLFVFFFFQKLKMSNGFHKDETVLVDYIA